MNEKFRPWLVEGQEPPSNTSYIPLLATGATVGGIAAFGHKRMFGRTGYDWMLAGMRGVEEYSPAKIFRTFQLSNIFSPLESASQAERIIDPAQFAQIHRYNPEWVRYISALTGQTPQALGVTGITFRGGKLYAGKDVILEHAGVIRNFTGAAPRYPSAYARSLLGGDINEYAFSQKIPYFNAVGELDREMFTFVGGHSKKQAAWRAAAGYGTSLVQRINQLAQAPTDLPFVGDLFRKLPFSLGVTPSSGLKTLGKITAKFGLGLGAASLLYQQADWMVRKAEILDNTIFAEGITAAGAHLLTRANLLASNIAEYTGLHSYREEQERIAPGSTSLLKLAAFPLTGMMVGSTIGYGIKTARQIGIHRSGFNVQQASMINAAVEDIIAGRATEGVEARLDDFLGAEFKQALTPAQLNIATTYAKEAEQGIWGKVSRFVQSTAGKNKILSPLRKLNTPTKILTAGMAALFAAPILPFIPGALIPSERPEQLERWYSGEETVPIRKGRWWLFGASPFEGQRIIGRVPHWYQRTLDTSREEMIYGDDSPIERWFYKNFTYKYEEALAASRPAPVTAPAFEEVPFIGPLLGATIGQLIKPTRLVRPEEWMRETDEGTEYVRMPLKYGQRDELPELGELAPGTPISPYGATGAFSEQVYNLQEMVGLPGFTLGSIKKALTGSEGFFDEDIRLASMGDITSTTRWFWEKELGDPGYSELFRRLYPRKRSIPEYNPIRNQMPLWMPGEGDLSENFLIGDPYSKVSYGELRLPGLGYERRFSELKGVAPEDYPFIHRMNILGDIAPYSQAFKTAKGQVAAQIANNELSEEHIAMYKRINDQVKEQKQKKFFQEYKYKGRMQTQAEAALAAINEDSKHGGVETAIGRYWEILSHNLENPIEKLTPFSPASKFLHARSALEDYETTQIYNTEAKFWDRPLENFIYPAMRSAANMLGWGGVPDVVENKRSLEEYFDILKYLKYTGLKREAIEEGDTSQAEEYETKRRETLFGVNPYTHTYTSIFRALPRRERDYFNAFASADLEERERLMEILPENEKRLYQARWQMKDVADWQKAIKKDVLTDEQEKEAQEEIKEFYESKETEGYPIDEELHFHYTRTRLPGESYADWYRRYILLPKKLKGLPGPDFVGWHPQVDLEDIKLKVLDHLGQEPREYDIWGDQIRAAQQKPYLDKAAMQVMNTPSVIFEEDIRDRIKELLTEYGDDIQFSVSVSPTNGNSNRLTLDIQEDRTDIVRTMMRKGDLDY